MSPRLTKSINSSIEHNTFPDSAKIALVIKLDKGKPNKNGILNFRSVSILNTFLKANYFMAWAWEMFFRHKFLHIEKTIIRSIS